MIQEFFQLNFDDGLLCPPSLTIEFFLHSFDKT